MTIAIERKAGRGGYTKIANLSILKKKEKWSNWCNEQEQIICWVICNIPVIYLVFRSLSSAEICGSQVKIILDPTFLLLYARRFILICQAWSNERTSRRTPNGAQEYVEKYGRRSKTWVERDIKKFSTSPQDSLVKRGAVSRAPTLQRVEIVSIHIWFYSSKVIFVLANLPCSDEWIAPGWATCSLQRISQSTESYSNLDNI